MATLNVNNERFDIKEEQFFNIKSLIPQLKRQYPMEQFKFNTLQVNGTEIDMESDHPELIRPIEKSDQINLEIESLVSSEEHLLNDLMDLTSTLVVKIEECVNLLKENQTLKAKKHLGIIINAMEAFIVSSSYLCKENPDLDSLPYKDLQIHLLSVMKGISSAINNQDTIMLTDLLEYELKDNLTQWKIHIFSTLRKK